MTRARLYGLHVETDLDLHDVAAGFDGTPDVTVRSQPPFAEFPPPPEGDVLLDFATPSDHWYTVVRQPSGRVLLRVPPLCDFVIEPDLATVTVARQDDADEGVIAILTTGTLLSCLLFLRGHPVLHGSAVETGGGAIGFIGHSGQGKTTLAAALCAEGAAVVTDDVLIVDRPDDGPPTVRRGSRELRLRETALALVDTSTAGASRTSADARTVIAARPSDDHPPLRGLVIPRPRRDGGPLAIERLGAKDAVLAVMAFPRLLGWRDPDVIAGIFTAAADLAARVPVVVAHVPWDHPFDAGLARALDEALRP